MIKRRLTHRRRGRPKKIRISKKVRTRTFGHAVKGARTPAQIRAAVRREAARPRRQWSRSQYRRRRYG